MKIALCLLVLGCSVVSTAIAQQTDVGIEKRVPWTTSRIKGSPEPALPYVTERVFPELTFNHCLDMVVAPGSNRLFVVEQAGKIFSFPNDPGVKSADLVVDLAKEIPGVGQVYALAFHPDFERNRYCYVCYIRGAEIPDGTHIARFRMTDSDPPTIDVKSETTILTFLSGGHNGCCLKFGNDGYLYISTGDGGPANPPDILKTGQDVGDLLSSILRVDVDRTENGLNYRIPHDNPFVGKEGARAEIWAYGLRNPWRMSFDRKTGDLWVGDVGWELWELLDRIERGGNYGWAVVEGNQSTNPEWPRGPTPILPPTIEHPHTESSSITEGLTYYGTRLKELHGHHIYSDYDTGKFWSFRYQDGQVVDHREIADTTLRVVGFGEDHSGEFYILDHTAGTIHRLIANPKPDRSSEFPRKLSDTGLFAAVEQQTPAPGVISYSINAQPWCDGAHAERFVAIPDDRTITSDKGKWVFPEDTVFVKTLSFHERPAGGSKSRRIETQILHFDGTDWLPYTYRWNDDQSDANLVEASGADALIEVADSMVAGGKRVQNWRFSGRAECQRCHNNWSGPALGFNLPQLNRDCDYGGKVASQLKTLTHIQVLDPKLLEGEIPRLTDPQDLSADVNDRARAYLQANCAHCHRMHAGGAVLSQMQFELPLEKTMMVGVRPTQGTFGIHAAHVVSPADPARSVLLYRISKLGNGRMPYLGSAEVDPDGVKLIHDWIHQLPAESAKDKTGNEVAANLRMKERSSLSRLRADGTAAERAAVLDELLATTSGAMLLLDAIRQPNLPKAISDLTVEKASRHNDPAIRDLFEQYLPVDRRIKRLGASVNPKQILATPGDSASGRRLFFEAVGIACKNCHKIQAQGKDVGPDLTAIGKKLNRAQLLESMLDPSKTIDPKYVTYLAETDDGRTHTGLLVSKDQNEIILKDAQDKLIKLSVKGLEQLVPQRQSLMPELLLRDMTSQQVADLLEFLSSLK